MAFDNSLRITDGSMSWEAGIDSGRIPTIQSQQNPTGLKRNQLAWATNATLRGGGISQRTGWNLVIADFPGDDGLFEGAAVYKPDNDVPYLMACISGKIYRFDVWTTQAVTLLSNAATEMPLGQTRTFWCQGEDVMVIQADDFVTLPLFWDGTNLTRSTGAPAQVPAGKAMDYYMDRLWVQTDLRQYAAGNLAYGGTGRHSFLEWTDNGYLAGGGRFNVPSNAGSIRVLKHTANINTQLGQGLLFIGTRDSIYSLEVPVSRWDWNNISNDATGQQNWPIQRVVQQRYGMVSDWAVPAANGDLFYTSYDGVRSLFMAVRNYQQWGQTPLSENENRVIQFNDRSLYRFASGIEFDNRVLMTCLPIQTPVGVAHQGLMPLDFNLLTRMDSREPPAWEGMWEGLDHLQVLEESSGGLQRAFTFVHSRSTGKIQVWEITNYRKFDWNDNRVTWFVETPAFDGGKLFQLKELDSAEVWVDKVLGTVDFQAFYRSDQNACWIPWMAWRICSAKSTCENVENPVCYPIQEYCEGYRSGMVLPRPPMRCDQQVMRPSNVGYQFQMKLVVKGWCRIRAILLYLLPKMQGPYEGMVCNAELPMPNS